MLCVGKKISYLISSHRWLSLPKNDLIFRQHMNSLFQQSAKARSQIKQLVIAWIYRFNLSMLKSLFSSGYKPLVIKFCWFNDLGISDTFWSRRHSISMTVVYESKKTETRHICLPVISQLHGKVIVDIHKSPYFLFILKIFMKYISLHELL